MHAADAIGTEWFDLPHPNPTIEQLIEMLA
jgi:hypothetical protein